MDLTDAEYNFAFQTRGYLADHPATDQERSDVEQYDFNATEAVQLLELSPEQADDLTYSELMNALRDHLQSDEKPIDFTSD